MSRHQQPMYPVAADAASHGSSHLQWLAGLAMQALIERAKGVPDSPEEREEIALWSYRMAQAMQKIEGRLHIQETEIKP